MNLLQEALQIHADRLDESAGESVSYFRGSTELKNRTAIRGESNFEEMASEMDARTRTRTMDWLIRPSQLSSSGSRFEPARGDRIVTPSGETFEVYPGPDNQHWRWSDARQTFFRIHTVRRVAS